MLVGISSGATLAAIAQKLPELGDRAAGARLQLRYRRALFVGPGFPSRRGIANRPLTPFLSRAVNSRSLNGFMGVCPPGRVGRAARVSGVRCADRDLQEQSNSRQIGARASLGPRGAVVRPHRRPKPPTNSRWPNGALPDSLDIPLLLGAMHLAGASIAFAVMFVSGGSPALSLDNPLIPSVLAPDARRPAIVGAPLLRDRWNLAPHTVIRALCALSMPRLAYFVGLVWPCGRRRRLFRAASRRDPSP